MAASKGSSALPPPHLGPIQPSLVKWLPNQLLPPPRVLVALAATAAAEGMVLGEADGEGRGWSSPGDPGMGGRGSRDGSRNIHRLGLSQARSCRFQAAVEHNNTPSGVSPAFQYSALLPFPIQRAAVHMIHLHLSVTLSSCTVPMVPISAQPWRNCSTERAPHPPQPHPLSALPPLTVSNTKP